MPDTGFHFKCLDYDTTAGTIRTVTIREGQPTLRAICESDETYTVETYANPSRGGTVTGAATGLHYGDVVTVEAIPAPPATALWNGSMTMRLRPYGRLLSLRIWC